MLCASIIRGDRVIICGYADYILNIGESIMFQSIGDYLRPHVPPLSIIARLKERMLVMRVFLLGTVAAQATLQNAHRRRLASPVVTLRALVMFYNVLWR